MVFDLSAIIQESVLIANQINLLGLNDQTLIHGNCLVISACVLLRDRQARQGIELWGRLDA